MRYINTLHEGETIRCIIVQRKAICRDAKWKGI